jgi:chromosome segregation ATPase
MPNLPNPSPPPRDLDIRSLLRDDDATAVPAPADEELWNDFEHPSSSERLPNHSPTPHANLMREADLYRAVEEEMASPSEDINFDEPSPKELIAENAQLRGLLAEMKQLMEEVSRHDPEVMQQRIGELERELATKDEANRQMQTHLAEIEQQLTEAPAAAPPPPGEEDLAALSDELERERCQLAQERRTLEDDRRQLREDEEHLMKQMREMEVSMARERAEMARQRAELQRLSTEIRQELEMVQRDGALTARLAQFQRKHQELMARSGSTGAPEPPPPAPPGQPQPPKRDSGAIKRFFGGK